MKIAELRHNALHTLDELEKAIQAALSIDIYEVAGIKDEVFELLAGELLDKKEFLQRQIVRKQRYG
jgi:hypothetical protein